MSLLPIWPLCRDLGERAAMSLSPPEHPATLQAPAPDAAAVLSSSPATTARQRALAEWRLALLALWPATQPVNTREKWRACTGAALGILLAALASQWLMAGSAGVQAQAELARWLVAPLGASAVLVFAVPSSPLAQPWSVVGGNTLSALVGIACARWVPDAAAAAALAVGLAVGVMFALRCLHPPGGATALLMVLGGVGHFGYAFSPVLLDSALLVLAGLLYNNLTRRRWPHVQRAPAAPAGGSRFSPADFDAALARYNQVIDISRNDLEDLLRQAEASAYQRTLGDQRCADIMTPHPASVRADTSLRQAWALMRSRRVKALPVVDVQRHIVGIVTVADFMKQLDLDVHEGWGWRLRALIRPARSASATAAQTVGQVMTRQVRVASADRLLVDLVPVFSEGGHRHVPIIDVERRLVGIVTQSDLIRALYRAVR